MSKDISEAISSLNSEPTMIDYIAKFKGISNEIKKFLNNPNIYNKEELIHFSLIALIAKRESENCFNKFITNKKAIEQELATQMLHNSNPEDLKKAQTLSTIFASTDLGDLFSLLPNQFSNLNDSIKTVLESIPYMPSNNIAALCNENMKLETILAKFFSTIPTVNKYIFLEAKTIFAKEHQKSILISSVNGIEIAQEAQEQKEGLLNFSVKIDTYVLTDNKELAGNIDELDDI